MSDKEYQREYRRKYRAKRREQARKYRKDNPHKSWQYGIKHRYGVTIAEYERLYRRQRGRCAICHQPERIIANGKVKRLAVDHNHSTGAVRGLLCMRCNTALGVFEQYSKRIRVYLEKYK